MTVDEPARSEVMRAFAARVSGLVHGVGYRYAARRSAQRLGVTGWVRNERDGSVTVWAQGSDAALVRFSLFVEHGPPGAMVHGVTFEDVAPDRSLVGFEVRF